MWASGGQRGYLDTADNPKLLEGYDKVAAFRAAHGYNSTGRFVQNSSLTLVASNVPDKEESLVGTRATMIHEYSYEQMDARSLVELVEALAQQNGGHFGSIALLCHNSGGALLRLTATMDVKDERGLSQETDAAQVLQAIGRCVRPNGHVQLVACRIAATAAGKALLAELTRLTGVQFAAKEATTGHASGGTPVPRAPRAAVADTLADLNAQAHGHEAPSRSKWGPRAGKSTPIVETLPPAAH